MASLLAAVLPLLSVSEDCRLSADLSTVGAASVLPVVEATSGAMISSVITTLIMIMMAYVQ